LRGNGRQSFLVQELSGAARGGLPSSWLDEPGWAALPRNSGRHPP
jgi:hypothetical protein